MKNPIYEPKGKAKEYGDLAINIYTGCPHRCFYCFAPRVLRKDFDKFHTEIEPRKGIVQAVKEQIEREGIKDKLIHLCFTCDPYPTGYDSTPTREIIKIIKESGNHVQILTKGDARRDIGLLDEKDSVGVTLDGSETPAIFEKRVSNLRSVCMFGIKKWVSFEPVLNADNVIWDIKYLVKEFLVDEIKIGKLNYHPSKIDWKVFGKRAEETCLTLQDAGYKFGYYIKDSLREEMNNDENQT